MEVIIPSGALSVATVISIQPITNEMSAGAGLAYRLSPDSQQFLQPVIIRFHYDANDLLGTDKLAFDIAFQKSNNIWYTFSTAQLDSMAGTVSVNTNHFTNWALYKSIMVFPFQDVETNVNGQINLRVGMKKIGTLDDETGEVVWPLGGVFDYTDPSKVTWSVNGATGGNASNGTVSPSSNSATTVYTAPSTTANMMSKPIALVTATVDVPGTGKLYLPSNIKVKEAGKYKMTFTNDYTPFATAGGFSGSCNWAQTPYVEKGYIYFTLNADYTIVTDSIVNIIPTWSWGSTGGGGCSCTNVIMPANGMLHFTNFVANFVAFDSTITFTATYISATPTEITLCMSDVLTFPSDVVQIPDMINMYLPFDSIPFVDGWNTLGSIIIKKLQ